MESAKLKIYLLLIAALFCSGAILIGIYPYHPNSLIGWVVLYLISMPIVIFFEFVGEKTLVNSKVEKYSKTKRIAYGVLILGIILVASMTIINWLEPFLGKWGS